MQGYSPSCLQFSYDPDSKVVYRLLDFLVKPGYRVGVDGSVWSCIYLVSDGKGTKSYLGSDWKKLRLGSCGNGYESAWLKGEVYFVHRLVLLAFLGSCPEGMECCHQDGVRDNNDLLNLRWATHKSNGSDMVRHGNSLRGNRHPLAKLQEEQVESIHEAYKSGESANSIAARLGVSDSVIRDVLRGKSFCDAQPAAPAKLRRRGAVKLTEEQVRRCRELWDQRKQSIAGLARDFGISLWSMRDVVHRVTWKDVI